MVNIISKNRQPLFYGLAAIFFMVGIARYYSEWPGFWDIWLWDETFYMGSGIYTWNEDSFSSYESSPLYSYLYRFVNRFVSSPIDLFEVVGLLGTVGALLAATGVSWILSGSLLFALMVGLSLVHGDFALSGPRLIYAAIIVLLIGGGLGFSLRLFPARATVLALATFIVTFIRPEFVVAFYLMTLFAVGGWLFIAFSASRRQAVWTLHRRDFLISFCSASLLVLLCKIWSFPIIHGGARAMMAFGQHYSLFWAEDNHVDIDAFLNWGSIIGRELPDINSELQAIVKYPEKLLNFFKFNMLSSIRQGGRAILALFTDSTTFFIAFVVIVLIFSLLGARISLIKTRQSRGGSPPAWQDIVLWIVLASPSLISIVLIYPRGHYLVILVSIMVLGCALIYRRYCSNDSPVLATALSLAFAVTVIPVAAVPRPNMEVVNALQKQGALGRLLELDGGWCYYVPKQCISKFVVDIPNSKELIAYLDDDRINSIVVSPALLNYVKDNKHKKFAELLAAPYTKGWKRTQLTESTYLLQRNLEEVPLSGGMFGLNVMSYIHNKKLGDIFGVIENAGDSTLFVHPGATTPTALNFDINEYALKTGSEIVPVKIEISPKVPPDAIARAAGMVRATLSNKGRMIAQAVVSSGKPFHYVMKASTGDDWWISIDNLNGPDTDWVFVSFR